MQQLHGLGLVFRDVKPENFLIGGRVGAAASTVYMVDYGLAAPYLDTGGQHVDCCNEGQILGTARSVEQSMIFSG